MYSKNKAVEYAFTWWNKRNPEFYNFDNLGGDCTNFVSQCLYYGGINMNYTNLGWFYKSLNYRSPSWTGVEEFYNFSINNKTDFGIKTIVCDIKEIDVGDIVQLKLFNEERFHHTMIVTKILGEKNLNNILITCHTYDAKNMPLAYYNIDDIRFLKVLNN